MSFAQPDYSKYGLEKTKNQTQSYEKIRAHAIKRAKERYGVILNYVQYRFLCSCIKQAKNNKFKGVEKIKDSNKFGKSLWSINYNNHIYYVIWDDEYSLISTFLTKNQVCFTTDF
jgi:hypothetical protein